MQPSPTLNSKNYSTAEGVSGGQLTATQFVRVLRLATKGEPAKKSMQLQSAQKPTVFEPGIAISRVVG